MIFIALVHASAICPIELSSAVIPGLSRIFAWQWRTFPILKR